MLLSATGAKVRIAASHAAATIDAASCAACQAELANDSGGAGWMRLHGADQTPSAHESRTAVCCFRMLARTRTHGSTHKCSHARSLARSHACTHLQLLAALLPFIERRAQLSVLGFQSSNPATAAQNRRFSHLLLPPPPRLLLLLLLWWWWWWWCDKDLALRSW